MELQKVSTNAVQTQKEQPKTKIDPKMLEKVQNFESVLLNQFISAMQPKEGLFGSGFGGDYFQSVFNDEISKQLSKQLDMGLAGQMLKTQLQTVDKQK